MARKGIFRRITEGIGRIFRPEPPQRPTPPPPPPEPTGGPGGGPGFTGPLRDTWDFTVTERDLADIQERTGYSEQELFQLHFEIIKALDPEADDEELEEMWQDYLMAFVSDGMTHDTFFETWNIDPRDFDWQVWREAMGYGHKK